MCIAYSNFYENSAVIKNLLSYSQNKKKCQAFQHIFSKKVRIESFLRQKTRTGQALYRMLAKTLRFLPAFLVKTCAAGSQINRQTCVGFAG
jgi:hypothetical protein